MDLKVLQWNCRSVISKKSDLIYIINKYNPSIICLSETWLKPEFLFNIPGFTCIREDRADGYGGVAILVRRCIPFSRLVLPSHNLDVFNAVGIQLNNNISIISVYLPHASPELLNNNIDPLFSFLSGSYLVLGDFNSHHRAWGSGLTNSNGEQLLEIIDSFNLCVLNTGAPTRRTIPGDNLSAVDLSICTPSLASSLSWSPLPVSYGSDHYPLIISSPLKKHPEHIFTPRLKHNLSNADWNKFKSIVNSKVSELPSIIECGIANSSDALAKCLIDAANEIFPIKNGSKGKIPSPPWWDHDCTKAIRERKKIEKEYNQCMSPENYENLCAIMKSTKKLLKQKKRDGWKSFCASLSPSSCPTEVWRSIKRFRCAFNSLSHHALSPSIANEFLDKLAPPTVLNQHNILYSIDHETHNCVLSTPFSLVELKGILENVKDSSPGDDCIPYSFVANLDEVSLTYYLKLVNMIITSGEVPVSWRSQIVIPILKPNRPADDACSYRPIALSSVLAKLAEHLVKNRLEWYIENKCLLANSQFGFRKARSTMDSIAILATDIRIAFSSNESILAAFLDIHAAYDNVIISVLLEKMKQLGIPIMIINFISSMLFERHIHLNLSDGTRLSRILTKGLPQGSVLSPILYNIYTYDLDSSLNNISILQYADDLLLYTNNSSIETACSTMNDSLILLKRWLDCNGLELSPSKSKIVLFSRKRVHPNVNIVYDNNRLTVKNDVKFLGVILDSKLSGNQHCDYVVSKCERILNMMKCLTGVWWGAHPFSLRLIYNALIRSVLDYGSFLLQGSHITAFKKLDVVQHKALRLILGAMRSSPVNAMQVECAEPPLHLRRQFLCDKFLFKVYQHINHPLLPKLITLDDHVRVNRYWTNKPPICLIVSYRKLKNFTTQIFRSDKLPLFFTPYEALTLYPNISYDLGLRKSDLEANHLFNYIRDEYWQNCNYIFTDASKVSKSGNVGVGVFHKQYNLIQQIKLPPEATVFTGECFGIFKALEYIKLAKLNRTVIFTDSKSSLQAIQKYPFKLNHYYPILFDIRLKLHECHRLGLSVSLAWIPSHCGIRGNEKADQLAKDAVLCGDIHPYINYCHDLLTLPRIYLHDSWSSLWTGGQKGRKYFAIQPHISLKPWFRNQEYSKTSISSIIRMRLGHVCTPAHLARLHIVTTDICECGEDVGDLDHIFFSCPLLDHSSFFDSLTNLNVPLPTRLSCLLMYPTVYLSILSAFIHHNNIKI